MVCKQFPRPHVPNNMGLSSLYVPHAEALDARVELGATDGGVVRPEHLARRVVCLSHVKFVQQRSDLQNSNLSIKEKEFQTEPQTEEIVS